MTERGGPTTQSGILYQNSIAALYLGRLCDETVRPRVQTVVQVRVESLDHVDDTVVTFQDGHRLYIQAKEKVDKGSKTWADLWLDFAEQFVDPTFQVGRDRLCLGTSPLTDGLDILSDLCFCASGSTDATEWLSRHSNEQREMLRGIRQVFADVKDEEAHERIARLTADDHEDLFTFFRHTDVDVMSLQSIEQGSIYLYMPDSNEPKMNLFRLLRDRVGGEARRRKVFLAEPLRGYLIEMESVQFSRPLPIEDLRSAVWQCSSLLRHSKHTFADTGVHIPRSVVSEIVAWASASGPDKQVAMLLDRAGTGKSVVMRDVLHALDGDGVTTIAVKADLQLSGVSSSNDLATRLELPWHLDRIVQRLAEYGRVVVLIDQVDALSLSLAHDHATLAVVLDLVARLRTIRGVCILLSCRTFDRKTDPALRSIETAQEFVVSELSDDELHEVLGSMTMIHLRACGLAIVALCALAVGCGGGATVRDIGPGYQRASCAVARRLRALSYPRVLRGGAHGSVRAPPQLPRLLARRRQSRCGECRSLLLRGRPEDSVAARHRIYRRIAAAPPHRGAVRRTGVTPRSARCGASPRRLFDRYVLPRRRLLAHPRERGGGIVGCRRLRLPGGVSAGDHARPERDDHALRAAARTVKLPISLM